VASFEFKSPNRNGLEYLCDYHTFGRRRDSVDTHINHSYISKLHATIEWREPNWLLKDLSKNGIKLNNKIIPAQKAVVLTEGDVIEFAGISELTLVLTDLTPPKSILINQTAPSRTIDLTESLLLPNEHTPELALFLCPDREQWFTESVESGEENGPHDQNDIITFGGSDWRFLLVSDDGVTKEFSEKRTSLDDVVFRFDISQDEENTELTLIENGVEIELGERSHHYLLVHLLRHRLQGEHGTGWLDSQVLMKELGLEESHMNIQIFRARKQIASALPAIVGRSKLIERRRGALRAGIHNIQIFKEGVKEV